jgi:phage terminase large subunit
MKLEINGNRILDEMLSSDHRFILNVGGSRSGKTYAILQYILIYCLRNKDKVVTIARKTFPSLRLGAYREFVEMLKEYEIYKVENHNKTNNFYSLNGNTIQFISIDQSQKLRGLKHDLVFVDEVNEIEKEEADQLFMRTTEKVLMAENPSDAMHWSLKLKSSEDCLYLHSTYIDNPFLPQAIINQIESYKETDEDLWLVFGCGLPAKNNELVYTTYEYWNSDEDLYEVDSEGDSHPKFEEVIYGCDWGWNHPSAIMKVWIDTNYKRMWVKEIIHESFLTTDDLIVKMNQLGIDKDKKMYGDSAEPKTIESIKRAGFDIEPAMKEVNAGIDCVKSYKFFIHSESTKTLDELRRYKWKVKNEMKTDEPIKLFDDGLSATRYAVYTYTFKTNKSKQYDFDISWIDL